MNIALMFRKPRQENMAKNKHIKLQTSRRTGILPDAALEEPDVLPFLDGAFFAVVFFFAGNENTTFSQSSL